MSKALGKLNVDKFEVWRDDMLAKGWDAFKSLEYRRNLSRTKVAVASGVDLNALKPKTGNSTILNYFSELEKILQKNLPQTFIVKLSALEQYHDYVERLEQLGGKFPVDSDGDIDINRLCKSIGIPRARLNSPTIKKCLAEDMARIGTDTVKGKSVEERMESHLTATSSELSKCKQDLALAEEKIEGLTQQILQMESTKRRMQKESNEKDESLQHTIETGRRWTI